MVVIAQLSYDWQRNTLIEDINRFIFIRRGAYLLQRHMPWRFNRYVQRVNYLFCFKRASTQGHNLNNFGRGPLDDASYLVVSNKKIFSCFPFFKPM